jgi:plastocyanin
MKIIRAAALGAVLLILGVAAISCGDDDDDGGDTNSGDEPLPTATQAAAATATSSASATQPSGGDGETVSVNAADFSFEPASLTVSAEADTTIELLNSGSAPHTLTVYSDQDFNEVVNGATTDRVASGDTDSFTLTAEQIAGATQLFFRCEVHPTQMQGTITVE